MPGRTGREERDRAVAPPGVAENRPPVGRSGRYTRFQGDVVRLVLAGVLFGLTLALVAERSKPTVVEINLFRLINQLPGAADPPLLGVMQLGALAAVPVFAALAWLGRRRRLARLLAVGGLAAWATAKVVQTLVDQDPPGVVLGRVILHGNVAPGFSFPSTHAAVAAGLATVAAPYLSRPFRRVAWTMVALVGVARVYVGAHFLVDVIGGTAVGWGLGCVVHLVFGAPRGLPRAGVVRAALADAGLPTDGLVEVAATEPGTGLWRAGAVPAAVGVKVVSRDHPRSDWLWRVWRFVAFRDVDDGIDPGTPVHHVEREAYHLLTAERAGLRVPALVTTRPLGDGEAVLVRAWVNGERLSDGDPPDEAALGEVWEQLGRLHALGIAHGTASVDALVRAVDGRIWTVDLGRAHAPATDEERDRDVAELAVQLGWRCGDEQVATSVVAAFGPARAERVLAALQPLELSAPSRRRLAAEPGRLAALRAAVAAAAGVDAPPVRRPARVAARNLIPLAAALVLVNLLLPQVGQAHATVDALRRARWPWLVAVLGAGTLTYVFAAVGLIGASGRRLALGRTWAVQLAAAFTNRLAPGGVGAMATNVRYLESAGSARPDAVAAVGLNSLAGITVHTVGVAAVLPLLGASGTVLHFSGPDLPEQWPWLVAAIGLFVALGLLRWGSVLTRLAAKWLVPAGRRVAGTLRRPGAAAALFGGNIGVTAAFTAAFVASARAMGIGLPVTALAALFLGGSALASVAPTPGGQDGLHGAQPAGVATGPAVAAVLTYRLLTYWLPIVPGVAAWTVLRRNGTL